MDMLTDQEALRLGRSIEHLYQNLPPDTMISVEINLDHIDVVQHPGGAYVGGRKVKNLASLLERHCAEILRVASLKRVSPFDGMDN